MLSTFTVLAAAAPKKPVITLPEDAMAWSTGQLWIVLLALVCFFLVRPELWHLGFIKRIDPRAPALARITVGLAILWGTISLLGFARTLLTDEGLYLTEMARKMHADTLRIEWDPEHGFRHWGGFVNVLFSKWSVLHLRSDPPFVLTIHTALIVSALCLTLGLFTRVTALTTWVLARHVYSYTTVYFSGADTVLQCVLLIGVFMPWGEAYSLDTWRRRRRAILAGAEDFPGLHDVPPWASRMMMLQLAIVYSATGLLKSGATWGHEGTALYYAMNLDHFYRTPMTGPVAFFQEIQVLKVMTWLVHWWEMLFPVALLGVALNQWVDEARAGTWPKVSAPRRIASWLILAIAYLTVVRVGMVTVESIWDEKWSPPWLALAPTQMAWVLGGLFVAIPAACIGVWQLAARQPREAFDAWRHTVFGRRTWLGFGFCMHLGIGVSMNVGLFVPVMWAMYPVWLRAREVDDLWWFVGHRLAKPGEADRPARTGLRAWLTLPYDMFTYRVPRATVEVLHAPDIASVRRAALLRCWDVCGRLRFVEDPSVKPQALRVRDPHGRQHDGALAASSLAAVLPGLWLLAPLGATFASLRAPAGVRALTGQLSLRWLAQRA